MSAMMVVGIVGAAASIYSANEASQRAKEGLQAARESIASNRAIADELKKRQEKLVDKPLEARIAELQSDKLTSSGQLGLDRFNTAMAEADREIQANAALVGEGATGARELTQEFRKAQGLAGIRLQDEANKQHELLRAMSMAQQTPGWAGIATGTNTQQADLESRQADIARQEEQNAYTSAAKGLGQIGQAYAQWYYGQPNTGTNPGNAPGRM